MLRFGFGRLSLRKKRELLSETMDDDQSVGLYGRESTREGRKTGMKKWDKENSDSVKQSYKCLIGRPEVIAFLTFASRLLCLRCAFTATKRQQSKH